MLSQTEDEIVRDTHVHQTTLVCEDVDVVLAHWATVSSRPEKPITVSLRQPSLLCGHSPVVLSQSAAEGNDLGPAEHRDARILRCAQDDSGR